MDKAEERLTLSEITEAPSILNEPTLRLWVLELKVEHSLPAGAIARILHIGKKWVEIVLEQEKEKEK